ncbi:MAG: hypothetical protein QM690_00780 [Sphingobium sp.]
MMTTVVDCHIIHTCEDMRAKMFRGHIKAEAFRLIDTAIYFAGFIGFFAYALPEWGWVGGTLAFAAYCLIAIPVLAFLQARLNLAPGRVDT